MQQVYAPNFKEISTADSDGHSINKDDITNVGSVSLYIFLSNLAQR